LANLPGKLGGPELLGKFLANLPGRFAGWALVTELWAAAASAFPPAPQLEPALYSCNLPSKFGPGLYFVLAQGEAERRWRP
jgi:hypothetical protein